MCKYCEDVYYERKSINAKDYSYSYSLKLFSGISLYYKVNKIYGSSILSHDKEIIIIPHFCPMCGKKLFKEVIM